MTRLSEITIVRRLGQRNANVALAVAVVIAAGLAAWLFLGKENGSEAACPGGQPAAYWYDPMVPTVRYPGPGKSSMNMDLQPKCADDSGQGGVTVSPAMTQNLGIRVARAETRDIAPVIRAVGQVEFDQRLISQVQTLTPGFVETLTVRAEGEPAAAGRVIAEVYSPDLLAAQSEYRALLTSRSPASQSLRSAARYRLKLLGLPEASVRRLERGGPPQRTYPVVARTSGVVTQIGARPGAQVTLGQSIVTIQGLGQVLVVADVAEASLSGVHRGQPADITFPAYPGEVRRGTVDYIFPSLNMESRTARVRITLANPGGRLKQGMFAKVSLQGTGGMATVVPSDAVIDTGRRQVVIVRRNGAFVPSAVTVGRDVGEFTQILAGVQPGEEVVVSGQFLIDSEASLSGVIARLQANQPPQAEVATTEGVVLSLDAAHNQVTIRHEAVPRLSWPEMTMTFKVERPAMLRGLTAGSRIEFDFTVQSQNGSFVIESIRQKAAS